MTVPWNFTSEIFESVKGVSFDEDLVPISFNCWVFFERYELFCVSAAVSHSCVSAMVAFSDREESLNSLLSCAEAKTEASIKTRAKQKKLRAKFISRLPFPKV